MSNASLMFDPVEVLRLAIEARLQPDYAHKSIPEIVREFSIAIKENFPEFSDSPKSS